MRRSGWLATLAIACSLVLVALLAPAAAHVGSPGHLWKKHIRKLADKRYLRPEDADQRYLSLPKGTQHLAIPGHALVDEGGTAPAEGLLYLDSGTSALCEQFGSGESYRGGLMPPDGVTIRGLRVVFFDDDAGSSAGLGVLQLHRTPLLAGGATTHAELWSAVLPNPAGTAFRTAVGTSTAAGSQPVDTSQYAYLLLGINVGGDPAICAADITYTYE